MHPTWTGLVYNGHIGLISRKTPFQKQVMSSVCKNARLPPVRALVKELTEGHHRVLGVFLGIRCYVAQNTEENALRICAPKIDRVWSRAIRSHFWRVESLVRFRGCLCLRNGRLFFVAFKLPFSLVYPIWARR